MVAELTAAPDPVVAGGPVKYALPAANRWSVSRVVCLSVQVVAHMSVPVSAISGGGSCKRGLTVCQKGQTASWSGSSIGTGQAQVVQFTAQVDAAADGAVLRANSVARDTDAEVTTAVDVLVSGTVLSLGLAAGPIGVTDAPPEACLSDRSVGPIVGVIQHSALDRLSPRLPSQSGTDSLTADGPLWLSLRAPGTYYNAIFEPICPKQVDTFRWKGRAITFVTRPTYPTATFPLNSDNDGNLQSGGKIATGIG